MKIVLIGSGNVAHILGKLFQNNHLDVVQIVSRNLNHAKQLGGNLNIPFIDFTGDINLEADLYIIAVSDNAIQDCLPFLRKNIKNQIVVHTAGAVSLNILNSVTNNYGVFYPLQSLRKEISKIPDFPILIDGNNDSTIEKLKELANKISDHVVLANDETRHKLHLSAVLVNNFTNHLYTLAEYYCHEEKIDFDLLKPLINETTSRLVDTSPSLLQTGPAKRNDHNTIEKHLRLLNDYPQIKKIYLQLSESIMKT
jgi:predicted short-subunit dehydrogenase-like oxidoreductase (DUF2520 family)